MESTTQILEDTQLSPQHSLCQSRYRTHVKKLSFTLFREGDPSLGAAQPKLRNVLVQPQPSPNQVTLNMVQSPGVPSSVGGAGPPHEFAFHVSVPRFLGSICSFALLPHVQSVPGSVTSESVLEPWPTLAPSSVGAGRGPAPAPSGHCRAVAQPSRWYSPGQ